MRTPIMKLRIKQLLVLFRPTSPSAYWRNLTFLSTHSHSIHHNIPRTWPITHVRAYGKPFYYFIIHLRRPVSVCTVVYCTTWYRQSVLLFGVGLFLTDVSIYSIPVIELTLRYLQRRCPLERNFRIHNYNVMVHGTSGIRQSIIGCM